jgi:hypothetical protein
MFEGTETSNLLVFPSANVTFTITVNCYLSLNKMHTLRFLGSFRGIKPRPIHQEILQIKFYTLPYIKGCRAIFICILLM